MSALKKYGILILVILTFGLSGCKSEADKIAETRLAQARLLAGSGQAETSLMLLDSMQVWYSQEYRILNQVTRLRDSVAIFYHEGLIATATRMIDSLHPEIEKLSKNFRFIPGEAGQPGTFEHKRQSVQNSWNRVFLKVNVNEQGDFWITSHYFGQEWLDHFCIKVYDRDLAVFSDTIPLSDPWNRKVEDLGDKWETIDFKEGTDGGAAAFIADHQNLNLKIRFTGKKHFYIVMENFDKEAVKDGYDLAQVLSEKYQLEQSIARNRKALRLLSGNEEVRQDTIIQN